MTRRRRNTLLSGQAGIVVLVDGTNTRVRHLGEDTYRPCRAEDVPYFFSEADDVMAVTCRSPEQAYRHLEHEWTLDRALLLMLILLDGDAHLRAKRIAAARLETLLGTPDAAPFILHRLYAKPLPSNANVTEALEYCVEAGSKTVWGLITSLREHQPLIAAVRERWELLDEQQFGGYDEKRSFEQVAIEEGLFYDLANNQRSDPLPGWLTNPRVKTFPYAMRVVHIWADTLLAPRKAMPQSEQLPLFDRQSERPL